MKQETKEFLADTIGFIVVVGCITGFMLLASIADIAF